MRCIFGRIGDSLELMLLLKLPLYVNVALFILAAVGVWTAGTALAKYANALADRLKLAKALMGLLFLALATELPEVATTLAAAIAGNASLVLNNMFGGITMQTAVLAVTDAFVVRGALTFYPRKPTHALEGTLLILLLVVLLGICIAGEQPLVLNIGMGTITLACAYIVCIRLLRVYDRRGDWMPGELPDRKSHPAAAAQGKNLSDLTLGNLKRRSIVAALVILICGFVLVRTAEEIAIQTGLGTSFVGVTILAAATSLPELSTTISAARLGAYTMAISNIFGSNLIMLVLLLPADLFYRNGPILQEAGKPEALALVFGIIVTAVYVAGLLVRKKPQVLRMGVDSLIVLVLYAVSIWILYQVS